MQPEMSFKFQKNSILRRLVVLFISKIQFATRRLLCISVFEEFCVVSYFSRCSTIANMMQKTDYILSYLT